ncbi:MAG: hypothetical protein CML42_07530 [Rhodobacteraceae bacterium]|nr:hypothetical protein [Paracoccaceae bacterium]|tara:strand:+ start:8367 stop:9338 length:972 start_codon:yes stop_codon:yes gene_type:complete
MDINKLVKDITNVFNGNTHSIKRKKYDDDLSDGIKYLSNKDKRLKHLENRIQMVSGNNVEGMENIDYMDKGHSRVKMLNDADKQFFKDQEEDYSGNLTEYNKAMTTFMNKHTKVIDQVKGCTEVCGDIRDTDEMNACKVGCKLRSPILDGNIVKCEDKYNNQNLLGPCNIAYSWKDANGDSIENDLTSTYAILKTQNTNLKNIATKIFNQTSKMRKTNNSLMQKIYNSEAAMGRGPDKSINSNAGGNIYQGKGKMKEFENIKAKLKPGSNPKISLTPAQTLLRIMEKDSIVRLEANTMRTYLWVAGTIGIVGGTIYYINKNSD